MLNLSTKEKFLLEDEKQQEELCVGKYNDYSNKANDPELKTLFSQLAQKEQEHLNTINQILGGLVPNTNQQQDNQQNQLFQQQNMPNFSSINSDSNATIQNFNQHDKSLCLDALSTEKFVSSTYNSAIFEFTDTNIRQVLNHIQKEEQEHGEKIFNYMHQHGMYNIK